MQRILLVEDNADLAEGLQRNLEVEGYDVRLATRAAEALAQAASGDLDLVVLDLGLPDMDGFHVLHELRARGSLVPVLILSARGLETDKVQGFRLGADDYVTKPFGVMELLARVAALLRRAQVPAGPAVVEESAEMSDDSLRDVYGLTRRQIAVARLLGEGCTNTEIAARLSVSAFTARNHTEQVLSKLRVSTRARVGAILRGRA